MNVESEATILAKAVATEVKTLSSRSPLLFSIVACVFAIGGTVVACVVLMRDPPITKQTLDEVLRPYAHSAEVLSKQQFESEVQQRNAASERFLDQLKMLGGGIDRLERARVEDKADIKATLLKIETELGEQRARVDRVLERPK